MAEDLKKRAPQTAGSQRRWLKQLLPLFGVGGVLVTMTLLYFGYDYLSARAAPCEAIFRQSALSLSTKIDFLKTKGEIEIGREPLIELSERAQMTALNLKTCCIVLDAGALDPEKFLQCKAKARSYEARVETIVTLVDRATPRAPANSTKLAAASGKTAALPTPAATVKKKIATNIAAARVISQTFNKEVVAVRKAQALETLELVPPRHVDISAKEREPNNDTLNTNLIELGKWITASIGAGKDLDFFAFTTPAKHRDWIKIELQNRSTTLEPRIELYDADKTNLGKHYKTTKGADIAYNFVGTPKTRYAFRISNYYGGSVGGYHVRVIAAQSYDQHEPNETILTARTIQSGKIVTAGIMDGKDVDFFRVAAGPAAKRIEVKITNKSTKLHPAVSIFNDGKSILSKQYNTTAGGDLSFSFKIAKGSAFYIRVSDYYAGAAGAYELNVGFKK